MRLRRRSSSAKKWIYSVLVILAILSSAPLALKWYAVQELESKNYTVEIASLGINFFTGGVQVVGLSLSSPDGDRLNVANMQLDVSMVELFRGRLSFDSIELDGAIIDVESKDSQIRLGGIDLSLMDPILESELGLEVGRVKIESSEFCSHGKQQCLHVGEASVNRTALNMDSDGWHFKHQSPLLVKKAFLRNLSDDVAVFYIDSLNVAEAEYSTQTLELGSVTLKNFQFVKNDYTPGKQSTSRTQTQIGELTISELRYNGGDQPELFLGLVDAVSPKQAYSQQFGYVQKSTTVHSWLLGMYQLLHRGVAGDSSVHLTVEKLSIQGGVLSWRDSLVSPPAKETLTSIHIQLGSLDTHKPEMLAPLSFSSKLGEKGLVKFDGHISLMGLNTTLKGQAAIQDWDMSHITAYTKKMFYQQVSEGTVDIAFGVDLKSKHLEMDSRWQMAGFKMGEDGSNAKLVNAMKLLKDRNQSVRFSLPVSGDIGSKNISVDYVFGHLISNTLQRLASNQVSGGREVVSEDIALGQGNRLKKMVFRSLLYPANARKPAEVDMKRLWEIAELLKSKPHLTLSFCPVSTAGEWADVFNNGVKPGEGIELNDDEVETLKNLASARGKVLSEMLRNQGVFSGQVKICEATIDMSQMGQSFVTVSM